MLNIEIKARFGRWMEVPWPRNQSTARKHGFLSHMYKAKCNLVDFFKGYLFLITKTFCLIRMYIQLLCFYCHC